MSEFKQPRVSQAVWPWMAAQQPAPKPESCRRRALVQSVVMVAVAGLLSLKFHHAAVTVSCVAAFVVISGVFIPRLFLAVERGFKAFGMLVGVALTWVLLVPFFFLVFAPARLCMLFSGKDPMARKFPAGAASCWLPHKTREDKDHYTKQYK